RADAGHRYGQRAGHPPDERTAASERAARARLLALEAMTSVAGPELVAAIARQRDGHQPACGLRHVIGRHGRRVAEGFVEMPREPRKQPLDARVRDRKSV